MGISVQRLFREAGCWMRILADGLQTFYTLRGLTPPIKHCTYRYSSTDVALRSDRRGLKKKHIHAAATETSPVYTSPKRSILHHTALEDDPILGLTYIQHCGAWHVVTLGAWKIYFSAQSVEPVQLSTMMGAQWWRISQPRGEVSGGVSAFGKADALTVGDRRMPKNVSHVLCHVEYPGRQEAEDSRVISCNKCLATSIKCCQAYQL
jgi:hypothetical protein